MARKSKEFADLFRQKQQPNHQQQSLQEFTQQVKQQALEKGVADVVLAKSGELKMSEVLQVFVKPYLHTARDHNDRQKLLTLSSFAWNFALLPEESQQQEINQLLDKLVPDRDPQLEKDIREILQEMITRKQVMFPEIQRYVVDLQMKETRQGFDLAVVSTEGL